MQWCHLYIIFFQQSSTGLRWQHEWHAKRSNRRKKRTVVSGKLCRCIGQGGVATPLHVGPWRRFGSRFVRPPPFPPMLVVGPTFFCYFSCFFCNRGYCCSVGFGVRPAVDGSETVALGSRQGSFLSNTLCWPRVWYTIFLCGHQCHFYFVFMRLMGSNIALFAWISSTCVIFKEAIFKTVPIQNQ